MSGEVRKKALLIHIEESLIARRNGLRAALMTRSVACRQRPCGFTKMICYTLLKTWATHEYGYWVRTSKITQIISHSLRNDDKKDGAFLARYLIQEFDSRRALGQTCLSESLDCSALFKLIFVPALFIDLNGISFSIMAGRT